jgi:hypothetical protein
MKLLSRIFHQNSKKDPKNVDRGSYYLLCIHAIEVIIRRKPQVEWHYNLLVCTVYVFMDACVKDLGFQIFVGVRLDNN